MSSFIRRAVPLLLSAVVLSGCPGSGGASEGEGEHDEEGEGEGEGEGEADPPPCDLSATLTIPDQRPVQSGDFCDAGFSLCAAGDGSAPAAVALWVSCTGERGPCEVGYVHCTGDVDRTLDDAELADICEMLALDPPVAGIECVRGE